MDSAIALPPKLLQFLSDPDRSLWQTRALYEPLCRELGAECDGVFQESLRLKTQLDELENSEIIDAAANPQTVLARLVNCEYVLYDLNAATPLTFNPFLSHWVEVIRNWEPRVEEHRMKRADAEGINAGIDVWDGHETRLNLVREILSGSARTNLQESSPRSLCMYFRQFPVPKCSIQPFIKILEDEGIYEKTPEPQDVTGNEHSVDTVTSDKAKQRDDMPGSEMDGTGMPGDFGNGPEQALRELVRMPIDLPSLELMNSFLKSDSPAKLGRDPASIVRDFIQHGLRSIEGMAESTGEEGENGGGQAEVFLQGRGREAQNRAIKLLVLFIRNLVRKDFIAPQDIFFEVQEICVRYIWIKEVRDLKAFLQEGDGAVEE